MENEEPTHKDRSVSGKDQLNYRTTIQYIVDRCFKTIGTFAFKRHVKALRMGLFFQIPGLPFKDRIQEKEKELDNKINEMVQEEKQKLGRNFYSHVNQAKLKIKIQTWYNETKFEYLLDLLAEHDALMKAKDFIDIGEMD